LKTCGLWDVIDESEQASLVVESDIPTLILSGAFDPTTPPEYAEEAAKTLLNSYSYLFPSGGHGELFSFPCAAEIMFEFLEDPSTRPDGSCIPDQPPQFVTARSVVRLPAVMEFLNFQGSVGIELATFSLALFFLLTAMLVYPIVWIYRLIRGKQGPAAPVTHYPAAGSVDPFDSSSSAAGPLRPAGPFRPAGWKLAPWLAVLVGLLLLVFTVVLAAIILSMAMNNDVRFLVGVPGAARPLFILPPLAALLAAVMVVIGLNGWLRGWGSVWGRLYFSLLTAAALVCVALLTYWGMLTAIL
jgi:hypothetical protein